MASSYDGGADGKATFSDSSLKSDGVVSEIVSENGMTRAPAEIGPGGTG